MPENAKKPQIRFKGFTDAWEQRKLNEINTFFTDGNYGEAYPKQSDLSDSTNGIPFLTGGNLKNGILDLTGASYITKEKHKKLMSGHLLEDDIVIAVRGSLGALGYVTKKNVDWNINSQLAILRTDKERLIGSFLIQYLLSENAQNDFLSLMTGSALKQLPISQLKNLVVPVTLIHEQELIAQLFNRVDNLITLHQRKLDKLKNIKKSMLEKMFPKNGSNVPEIRFTGFTDAWEQRKLGSIVIETIDNRGKNPPYYCESGIPIIDNFMIKNSGYPDLSTAVRYIDKYLFENFIRKHNKVNDILITLVGNGIGNIALFPKKEAVIIQNTLGLRFTENEIFMYYTLLFQNYKIIKLDRGMAQPNIRQDELKDIYLHIPTMNEQIKLEKYFQSLDNLITLHQRKLEKLQNIKKACLEKMFV